MAANAPLPFGAIGAKPGRGAGGGSTGVDSEHDRAFPALGFFAEEKTAARGRYPYALFGLYGAFALVSCLVELDVIPQDRICALGNGGSCLRTSS